MTSAIWARRAFAHGYAETGDFPVCVRARAVCRAIEESRHSSPALGVAIIAAGRKEGHRLRRERAHRRLYGYHSELLAGLLMGILAKVNAAELAPQIVEHASQQAQAGSTPVMRRRAVAGLAASAIRANIHADERAALTSLNAAGWAHATAYGRAEAQSTSLSGTASEPIGTSDRQTGGPPDMAKVAAVAAAALVQIPDAEAQAASAAWADQEINTIAMGAALAAGDGKGLDEAVRAVKAALLSTTRATNAYADQLHKAVNQAFVARAQTLFTEALFDWVTNSGNPCPTCTDLEAESPYEATDLPDCPLHANCECNIEVASAVPALVGATTGAT